MDKQTKAMLLKSKYYYKHLLLNNNSRFDFKKPIVLFGAGNLGEYLLSFFQKRGTKILAFSDNDSNKIGKYLNGIKIINKNDINNFYGKKVQIVASSNYFYRILVDLKKKGFINLWNPMYFSTRYSNDFDVLTWKNNISMLLNNLEKIDLTYKMLKEKESKKIFLNVIKYRLTLDDELLKTNIDNNDEYFNNKIIKLTNKEIFLDGGAFDGDTLKTFIKKTNNHFLEIYAFEPDNINYKKLSDYTSQNSDNRIKIYCLGLGSRENTLSFTNEGSLQSRIVIKNSSKKIKIVSIDKFNLPFTYIKLDIEGYEKKALLGARKTLKNYKPKLAICIYHKIKDLWEIPLLIKKINPTYRIYLRRYTDFLHETICYAV